MNTKLLVTNSCKKTIFVAAVLVVAMNTFAFGASGTWAHTGSMISPREGHTATLLVNGKVLVAGGTNNGVAINSAELYNHTTGTWASTGSMHVARTLAGSVLLSNGSVLVVGGCLNDCLSTTTNSAELYNPATGTFTATGSMVRARAGFGIALLANGHVLVAGGCTAYDQNGCAVTTTGAEIYDPSTRHWTATGSLRGARFAVTATRLASGKVLVAGGATAASDALNSSEIYDPTAKTWSLGPRMMQGRSGYASIMLTTGKVLLIGGENINGVSVASAELYNPSTGTFTATGSMTATRVEHTAVLLASGKVLVSGGYKQTSNVVTPLASAELYNPATGTWSATGSMSTARGDHTSTLLTNGFVLSTGGSDTFNELNSAELYTQ